MTRPEIIALQRQLLSAGYGLKVDGVYGPKTAEAYQDWLNAITPETALTPAPVGAKPWYLSRSVIGILVSLIAVIAERAGWMIDANEATILVMQLLEFGGLALAFIGTVRRRASIDPTLMAPGLRYPTRANPVRANGETDKPAGPFGY